MCCDKQGNANLGWSPGVTSLVVVGRRLPGVRFCCSRYVRHTSRCPLNDAAAGAGFSNTTVVMAIEKISFGNNLPGYYVNKDANKKTAILVVQASTRPLCL